MPVRARFLSARRRAGSNLTLIFLSSQGRAMSLYRAALRSSVISRHEEARHMLFLLLQYHSPKDTA